jgi:16S rRNA (adenine1518-N6/adenine1519-N6)-dimethyltransferase
LHKQRPLRMQTKHRIQELLASAGVRPNRKLGQHFLIDLNLMRLLVDAADIHADDVVLEVGCGTGSLTEGLVEKAGFVVAVEFDACLAGIAKEQLAQADNLCIITADVLQDKRTINRTVADAIEDARKSHTGRLLLVANLPYNAASAVVLNLITGQTTADAMFVTIQKEVAERMTAHPGTKDYGILSILLSTAGSVRHIRTLRQTVFWPQPQVDSAMISYIRDAEKLKAIKNIEMLSKVAGGFLQHRRKMLKSCCKLMTGDLGKIENWPEIFHKCGIDPESRPDQLEPGQFVALANLCCDAK